MLWKKKPQNIVTATEVYNNFSQILKANILTSNKTGTLKCFYKFVFSIFSNTKSFEFIQKNKLILCST